MVQQQHIASVKPVRVIRVVSMLYVSVFEQWHYRITGEWIPFPKYMAGARIFLLVENNDLKCGSASDM